jgi:hypothetical protein
MASKPTTPGPLPCPHCATPMKPHCERTVPAHGGTKAKACGWAICPKPECRTVIRLRDKRILPTVTGTSK